jgi:HEPN domain-containing protein
MSPQIDVQKQVEYWKKSSTEDLLAASDIITRDKHIRQGLFFLHLALEKMLKARVCKTIQDVPPRIHDLVRLVNIAGIALSQDKIDLLLEVNAFNLEGRYPEYEIPSTSLQEAKVYLAQGEELIKWLSKQL